jgi:phage terminase small subunit
MSKEKRAKAPHNSKRPESAAVCRALEDKDIPALEHALTPRQRAFCYEYVVDYNATKAAIRAGYAARNAHQAASLVQMNRGVQFLIDHLSRSKEAKIISIDPDYVLSRVTQIINAEGAKDSDKLRGLELLARHLGMLTDRTEITGKDGEAIQLEHKQKIEEEADAFTMMLEQLRDRVTDQKKDITISE